MELGKQQISASGVPRLLRDRTVALVYPDLDRIARHLLAAERTRAAWAPADLIHETLLRLLPADDDSWNDTRRLVHLAARVMRRVLIDSSRRRNAEKRRQPPVQCGEDSNSSGSPESLNRPDASGAEQMDLAVFVGEALAGLAAINGRATEVVKLRVLHGLTDREIAARLLVTSRTVARDWRFARDWLRSWAGLPPESHACPLPAEMKLAKTERTKT